MDFGHVGPRASLTSTIRVEELLEKDKDIYVIGCQLTTEIMRRFHYDNLPEKEFNESRIKYSTQQVNNLKKGLKGQHCGDCTAMPGTCSRCQIEKLYQKGEKTIKIWKLLNSNGDIEELLSLLLATMGDWKGYLERKDVIPEGDSTAEFFNLTCFAKLSERHQIWQELPEIEKEHFRDGARIFRSYF